MKKAKFGLKVHATFDPNQHEVTSGSGKIRVEENGAETVNNPSETDILTPYGVKAGSMTSI